MASFFVPDSPLACWNKPLLEFIIQKALLPLVAELAMVSVVCGLGCFP